MSKDVQRTCFLLIRHAETEWNAAGLWQGHADSPLTKRGVAQAALLAEGLAETVIDRIVCSDLGRCLQTVAPLAARIGLRVEPMRGLRELDVGSWSGLSRDEIRLRDPDTLRRFDAREDVRPGGAEKRSELALRVHRVVEQLASESPERCIAVVTHSGVVRALQFGRQAEHAQTLRVSLAQIREVAAEAGQAIGSGRENF